MPESIYKYDRKNSGSIVTINNFIGAPPKSYISDAVMLNSLPVLRVTPQKPKTSLGLTLFTLESAQADYNAILNNLGFALQASDQPLRIVFNADTLPVDSFTNDYTETFLQKMTDVASQGMAQIMQMAGADRFSEGVQKIGQGLKTDQSGAIGTVMNTAADALIKSRDVIENIAGAMPGGAGDILEKMLVGHRIDFPKVWGNSAYTTNFSINVKLFNPRPNNDDYARQYLIGPLAAILCLALPRTDDGYSYNWPFFQKVEAPGFLSLTPAAITNITVTKGGDQHQLAFTKTLGMIDVRIDFISLFESMLLEKEDTTVQYSRPTIKNYLNSLLKDKVANQTYNRSQMNKEASTAAGASSREGGPILISTVPDPNNAAEQLSKESLISKNFSATRRVTEAVAAATEGPSRVSSSVSQASNILNTLNSDFIDVA